MLTYKLSSSNPILDAPYCAGSKTADALLAFYPAALLHPALDPQAQYDHEVSDIGVGHDYHQAVLNGLIRRAEKLAIRQLARGECRVEWLDGMGPLDDNIAPFFATSMHRLYPEGYQVGITRQAGGLIIAIMVPRCQLPVRMRNIVAAGSTLVNEAISRCLVKALAQRQLDVELQAPATSHSELDTLLPPGKFFARKPAFALEDSTLYGVERALNNDGYGLGWIDLTAVETPADLGLRIVKVVLLRQPTEPQ